MRTLSRSTKTNVDLWGICSCCCTPAVLLWYNVSWPLRSAEGRLAVGVCVCVSGLVSRWIRCSLPDRDLKGQSVCVHTPPWLHSEPIRAVTCASKRSCAVSDRSIAYLSFPLTSSLTAYDGDSFIGRQNTSCLPEREARKRTAVPHFCCWRYQKGLFSCVKVKV